MKRILTVAAVALAASLAFCGTPARATEGHPAPQHSCNERRHQPCPTTPPTTVPTTAPTTEPPTTPPTTAPTTAPTTQPTSVPPTTTPATTEPTTTAPTTQPTSVAPTTSPVEVSPSASRTSSAPAAARPTTTNVADGSDSLPLTGPSIGYAIGLGMALFGAGAVLLIATRRRKEHFRL